MSYASTNTTPWGPAHPARQRGRRGDHEPPEVPTAPAAHAVQQNIVHIGDSTAHKRPLQKFNRNWKDHQRTDSGLSSASKTKQEPQWQEQDQIAAYLPSEE
jgi:hypothetical protein